MTEKHNSKLSILRLSGVVAMVALLSACAHPMLPERWASTGDAYPNDTSMVPPKNVPDSYETAIFTAPYEDVYRAALVSASQAQFNVTYDDKRKGHIFAKRLMQSVPTISMNNMAGGYADRRYFYAVKVIELGARKSRVTIMAKAQGQCQAVHGLANVVTLGIGEALAETVDNCAAYSSVHWAQGFDSSETEMSQYITFVRNNLIAAGVL